MPVANIFEDSLFSILGSDWDREKFEDICFKFGLEVDEVIEDEDGRVVYKIEVPSNRHDLLCVEGITKAILCYIGASEVPKYKFSQPSSLQSVYITKNTSQIRPYFVGAVLRNISFTEESLKSFIDLQDKLHHNLCRKRKLASIGTHDLDTIQGPFIFDAKSPNCIQFIPLKTNLLMNGYQIIDHFSSDAYIKPYLSIINNSPVFPIIYDKNGVVLSLPPIINSLHTKITTNTKNIFIDCTALDLSRAQFVVNILVSTFSEYCNPYMSIEPINIEYDKDHIQKGGQKICFPSELSFDMEASIDYIELITGIPNLTYEMCNKYLQKMMISSSSLSNERKFIAHIPLSRPDILHQCDLAEDIAISFGYNNINFKELYTVKQVDIQALQQQIKRIFAMNGFIECLNWGLCSLNEAYNLLLKKININKITKINNEEFLINPLPVYLSNPKTKEFEIIRTSLLPALLKSLYANKSKEMPHKLFEIGDIVYQNTSHETNSTNVQHVCCLYSNKDSSGFEEVHGMLDILMERFNILADYAINEIKIKNANFIYNKPYYTLQQSNETTFLNNRQAYIKIQPKNINIGIIGTLHPNVLKNFSIINPVAIMELNTTFLLNNINETDLYED